MTCRASARCGAAAVTLLLLLASCGGPGPGSADKGFVARMIPHHELGMDLIDEATLRSDGVELRRMVFEMGSYHHDEMARLQTWSREWHVPKEEKFPGSIDAGRTARLARLDGAAHDTWWLHLMIEHHEGAVEIAADALSAARHPDLLAMARTVRSVQERQITEMKVLLGSLCVAGPGLPGC